MTVPYSKQLLRKDTWSGRTQQSQRESNKPIAKQKKWQDIMNLFMYHKGMSWHWWTVYKVDNCDKVDCSQYGDITEACYQSMTLHLFGLFHLGHYSIQNTWQLGLNPIFCWFFLLEKWLKLGSSSWTNTWSWWRSGE